MKLRRLSITQLPGITSPFTLADIADGINIVTGPNAAGKSSLVRALRHLVDERYTPDDGALTLEAEFESTAGRWTVRRSGSQLEWRMDGRRTEPPPLPGGDFLRCYWLGMQDLLEAGSTEGQIAASLRQSLYGGFDLDAVRDQLARPGGRGEVGPRHGQNQARTLQECRRRFRAIDTAYTALEGRRGRLAGLDEQITEAETARVRADRVQHALEWLKARRALAVSGARLNSFPAGMDRLTGTEADDLDGLLTRRRQVQGELSAAAEACEVAEQRIEATGLGGVDPDTAQFTACREHLNNARGHAQDIARLQQALDDVQGELRDIAARLNAVPHESHDPASRYAISLDAQAVNRAVEIAEKLRDNHEAIARLQAARVEPVGDQTLTTWQSLLAELRRWLSQAGLSQQRGVVTGTVVALTGAVAAAALLITVLIDDAGALPSGLTAAALLGAAVATAGAAVTGWKLRGLRAELASTAQRIREHAEALDLQTPTSWTAAGLRAWLNELEPGLAALRFQAEQARHAEQCAKDAKPLFEERTLLQRLHTELAQRLGFQPLQTAEGTARFLQQALEYDRAQQRRAGLMEQHATAQRALAAEIGQVTAVIAKYRTMAVADTADTADVAADTAADGRADSSAESLPLVQARFDELTAGLQRLSEARRDLADAARQRERATAHLQQVDAEITRLLVRSAVPGGDQQALRDRCERYADYRAARADWEQARVREQERKALVGEDAEVVALVERDDEAGLDALQARLQQHAEHLASLRNEAADIRAEVKAAGEDQRLQQARLAHDRALDALGDAFGDAMLADAGRFLLDAIAAEHRAECEPAVLSAARSRFARFTNHRYRLEFDSDGTLRAHDNEHGVLHDLATLSTGTRMQLLIAVRLAWSGAMEQGTESLPIFLDEALTTTDPERFASMVQAFEQMADDEQRQIFYLSAQPLDVARWERASGRAPRHIDLPRVRFAASAPQASDFALPPPRLVPAPEGMSAQDYAATLPVPPLQPQHGATAVHLFHLLRDRLPLLHTLMNDWHVAHAGPFRELLVSDAGAVAVPDADWRERLSARILAAEVWVELWGIGRGRAVDRHALERSGAVSDTFLDEVTALAEQCGGDGRALLDGLNAGEVKRFQRAKAIELEAWLDDQGYLSAEPPLSADERLRRTLLRAGASAPVEDIRAVVASLEAALPGS